MRVLMLTSSYPRTDDDGAGSFVRSLARSVGQLGSQVIVLAPEDGNGSTPIFDENVRVIRFPYSPVDRLRILGYGRALRADVHLKGEAYLAISGFVVAALYYALRLLRSERIDVVHSHWLVPSGFVGAVGTRLCPTPLVISLHGSDVFLSERNPFARRAARFSLRSADAVAACSDDLRQRALALNKYAPASFVIPYGVDSDRFAPRPVAAARLRAALGLAVSVLAVVTVGRLVRKKGFEYLIDSVHRIKEITNQPFVLLIGGEGDLRPELEDRVSALGLGSMVRFIGNLSQPEVSAVMSAADVFVLPSVKDGSGNVDGLPNVLLEAMASARPVVATRIGGVPSVLVHGENGLLVTEKSVEALAQSIASLLDSASLRDALGLAARETVRRDYSWGSIASRYSEVYAKAASGVRKP